MDFIGQYILGLVSAAVFCAIINCLISAKGSHGAILKMLCGIFMTVTLVSPVLKLKLSDLTQFIDVISYDAQESVQEGTQKALDSKLSIIKQKSEAYILDKAAYWGLNLMVEVTLSGTNPPIPESVMLKGTASPYAKKQLSQCIADELGISEDQQKWI